MQIRKIAFGFCLMLGTFVLQSCGTTKELVELEKVKNINEKILVEKLFEQGDVGYNYLSSKVNVDFKNKSQDRSFAVYLKHNVDTALGGTIKFAQIIGAAFKVDYDSIHFTNKLERCYFLQNLDYLSELFGTDVEFNFFQDVILGLPIGLDTNIKYKQIGDNYSYTLSSHKKKAFRKLENDKLDIEQEMMLIQYDLKPNNFELFRTTIQVPSDSVTITINNVARKMVDGFNVPEITTIDITHPTDTIFVKLDYGSVRLNDWKEISVRIPETYESCR